MAGEKCPTCGSNGMCAIHPEFERSIRSAMVQQVATGIGVIQATVETEFRAIRRELEQGRGGTERALEALHSRVTAQGLEVAAIRAVLPRGPGGDPYPEHAEKRAGNDGKVMSLAFTGTALRWVLIASTAIVTLIVLLALGSGDRVWEHTDRAGDVAQKVPRELRP